MLGTLAIRNTAPRGEIFEDALAVTEEMLIITNCIVTWLTYLSGVEEGSATVFLVVDDHLKGKTGSAAFWYNLYALDEACFVLIEINERGDQEFWSFMCLLDSMA
ncbi:unnamed protein product [Adineta steineri]|uniref:Uncharacterized protein n=1 Tax=Adineta steineri TaxID=433720 RepID=A0A819D7Z5_9BILA|nr:unnamed protein product [Adineta steineri]